jgi:chemotaxis protein histidine kinase CheA
LSIERICFKTIYERKNKGGIKLKMLHKLLPIVFALMLVLAGCGTSSNSSSSDENTTDENQSTETAKQNDESAQDDATKEENKQQTSNEESTNNEESAKQEVNDDSQAESTVSDKEEASTEDENAEEESKGSVEKENTEETAKQTQDEKQAQEVQDENQAEEESNGTQKTLTYENNGQSVSEKATLTSSDNQGYNVYLLDGFTFSAEEPRKDVITSKQNSDSFMRIEMLDENADMAAEEENVKALAQAVNPDNFKKDENIGLANAVSYTAVLGEDETRFILVKGNTPMKLSIFTKKDGNPAIAPYLAMAKTIAAAK